MIEIYTDMYTVRIHFSDVSFLPLLPVDNIMLIIILVMTMIIVIVTTIISVPLVYKLYFYTMRYVLRLLHHFCGARTQHVRSTYAARTQHVRSTLEKHSKSALLSYFKG